MKDEVLDCVELGKLTKIAKLAVAKVMREDSNVVADVVLVATEVATALEDSDVAAEVVLVTTEVDTDSDVTAGGASTA